MQYITLKWDTAASFHTTSHSLFIDHPIVRLVQSKLLTASLNKRSASWEDGPSASQSIPHL